MTKTGSILVVDDESMIRETVASYLQKQGYHVLAAENGRDALRLLEQKPISFVILELMLPDLPGEEVCRRIRKKSRVPIIILTAKNGEQDMVNGLEMGADDYITKPFNPVEVMARVRSNIRRYIQLGGGEVKQSRVEIGGITLDDGEKNVYLDGELISLTPREYEILKLFMQSPGTVFSPKDIYRKVWGELPINAENAVAVHIRHLREKLEINPAEPRYIKVVWGQGSKIDRGL